MYPSYPYQSFVPPIQLPVQPQPQSIQYVNGKASAESYQMPNNSSVILMDSEQSRFYIKMTDAAGVATVKSYDFKETEAEKPVEYVTKAEFEAYKAKMKGGRHESNTTNADRKQ